MVTQAIVAKHVLFIGSIDRGFVIVSAINTMTKDEWSDQRGQTW